MLIYSNVGTLPPVSVVPFRTNVGGVLTVVKTHEPPPCRRRRHDRDLKQPPRRVDVWEDMVGRPGWRRRPQKYD